MRTCHVCPHWKDRVIFGMMVGNEGKTRIPIYQTFTQAGFDPEKDMLQTPVMPPAGYCPFQFLVCGHQLPPHH